MLLVISSNETVHGESQRLVFDAIIYQCKRDYHYFTKLTIVGIN